MCSAVRKERGARSARNLRLADMTGARLRQSGPHCVHAARLRRPLARPLGRAEYRRLTRAPRARPKPSACAPCRTATVWRSLNPGPDAGTLRRPFSAGTTRRASLSSASFLRCAVPGARDAAEGAAAPGCAVVDPAVPPGVHASVPRPRARRDCGRREAGALRRGRRGGLIRRLAARPAEDECPARPHLSSPTGQRGRGATGRAATAPALRSARAISSRGRLLNPRLPE